jgi:hypothetical protein
LEKTRKFEFGKVPERFGKVPERFGKVPERKLNANDVVAYCFLKKISFA